MDLTEAAKKAEPHRRRDFWAGFGCTTLVIILFVAMTIPGWGLNTGLGVMLTIFALGLAIGPSSGPSRPSGAGSPTGS